MVLGIKEKRFYTEIEYDKKKKNLIKIYIHDREAKKIRGGRIQVEISASILKIDVSSGRAKTSSNEDFIKMFGRSIGQELLIKAARWGKRRDISHIDISNVYRIME